LKKSPFVQILIVLLVFEEKSDYEYNSGVNNFFEEKYMSADVSSTNDL
jgi:hypothetical protein